VGDNAPQQSPVLVQRTLPHAVAVTFTAVGAIQHTPECPPDCHGPNGAELARHLKGAEHGIAGAIAPMDALMGVFLSDERPDRSKAPRSLDYRVNRGDISSSSPQLKQVFFIGDGKTSSGALRRYLVPAKATRLYLGVIDGYEWNKNSGSFTVTVAIERDRVDSAIFAVDSSITPGVSSSGAAPAGNASRKPDRRASPSRLGRHREIYHIRSSDCRIAR
jgi:hypothetical protein